MKVKFARREVMSWAWELQFFVRLAVVLLGKLRVPFTNFPEWRQYLKDYTTLWLFMTKVLYV